jgi:16S rRNA (guanine527-N7)-methyltransferase
VPATIFRYFPDLTEDQKQKISALEEIYSFWNSRINVISRKDFQNFYTHHVLHSLSIARVFSFGAGTSVLDVGTGGGFPGIPLSILFPEARFTLLDSIDKKIRVVSEVAAELKLSNVRPLRKRAEEEKASYSFVVSRAVTAFSSFVPLVAKNIEKRGPGADSGGIIYLKGGDLSGELGTYAARCRIFDIAAFFSEPFFETKKIVYLSF